MYQNSFCCFWLAQPIVCRDDLFNCTFWIILEFIFPIVQSFGVCITILGNDSQGLLIEDLLFVFIELHELMQIQNCLQHLSWLDLALRRFLDAFHDVFSLAIV